MNSVIPIAMLALTFFLVGGVISFIRNKQPLGVVFCGVAAVMAGTAAWLWW